MLRSLVDNMQHFNWNKTEEIACKAIGKFAVHVLQTAATAHVSLSQVPVLTATMPCDSATELHNPFFGPIVPVG